MASSADYPSKNKGRMQRWISRFARITLLVPFSQQRQSADRIGCAQWAGWWPKWLTNELNWKIRLMWSAAPSGGQAIPRMLMQGQQLGSPRQAVLVHLGASIRHHAGSSSVTSIRQKRHRLAAWGIQSHICIPFACLDATTAIKAPPLFSR